MTAQITAALVKELRDRTGVGMSKCKDALEQAKGNMEEAVNILRKAGLASAVKKQDRETKEGAIFFAETPNNIALVEINAETDFVVKNDKFQNFGKEIAAEVAKAAPTSVEAFLQSKYSLDPSITIDGKRALIIQLIGENIVIKRLLVLPKKANHSYGIYSHFGGKILCVTEIDADGQEELGKDIAMHVAAFSPEYVYPEEVPAEIIQRERDIARTQITNKPPQIMEKILDGKVNAYYDLVCLARQKFVKDDTMTVGELLKKRTAANRANPLRITRSVRWIVGG